MSKYYTLTLTRCIDDGSGEVDADLEMECDEVFTLLETMFAFIHNQDWFLNCSVEEENDE